MAMPALPPRNRPYKEVTIQQLRSFCETVRLGSFTAAAAALELTHPTVWKQVHALERHLGATLVEPYERGCRPTEAGRRFARLAGPMVAGIGSLERAFQSSCPEAAAPIVVAAPPRVLVEDLPDCIIEFERLWPQARLALMQVGVEDVPTAVASGEADLGLTDSCLLDTDDPGLACEPCYELDIVLVTPPHHPLARRRTVGSHDLCAYALVNAPVPHGNAVLAAALAELHALGIQPSRVVGYYNAVICRYVELGFGIGLIPRIIRRPPHPALHERSMSAIFGRPTVYLVWRKGTIESGPAHEFAKTVKALLSRSPADLGASSRSRKEQRRKGGPNGRHSGSTGLGAKGEVSPPKLTAHRPHPADVADEPALM
jgi:DNA-binding transcriptional LysR family regulator